MNNCVNTTNSCENCCVPLMLYYCWLFECINSKVKSHSTWLTRLIPSTILGLCFHILFRFLIAVNMFNNPFPDKKIIILMIIIIITHIHRIVHEKAEHWVSLTFSWSNIWVKIHELKIVHTVTKKFIHRCLIRTGQIFFI